MKVLEIDLYSEFKKDKQENAEGILTAYLPDVYKEINDKRKLPAILIMPGGGYGFVSPREAEPIALRYLAKGFAAFVLKYSTAPLKYPTAFLEAAMSMVYIRENADHFHLDTNKIVSLGFSAGGHLCGCLATIYDDEIIKDIFGDKSSFAKPNAVILSYPVITSKEKGHAGTFNNLCGEDKKIREYLSLEDRVTKNSVPAFIWHTFEDGAVPVYNSLTLAQSYEKHNVKFSLHIFEKGKHGLSTADGTAYRTDDIPEVSTGLVNWIEMSIDWLNDMGIKTEDT